MIKKIKLIGVKDVNDFIKATQKVYGDITVRKGKYVVDGKSIMGIFSLDPTSGIEVEYDEAETAFTNFLNQYEM